MWTCVQVRSQKMVSSQEQAAGGKARQCSCAFLRAVAVEMVEIAQEIVREIATREGFVLIKAMALVKMQIVGAPLL